jgi:hypothetical protein
LGSISLLSQRLQVFLANSMLFLNTLNFKLLIFF